MDNTLFESVDAYINNLLVPPDDALQAVEQSLIDAGMPQISVTASQGKLLHILARLCNARTILELGTLAGYSTIWLARALPHEGRLITLEVKAAHAEVARKNIARAGLQDRVDVRVGAALELLRDLVDERAGPFDLIFIDADKAPYKQYFEWALKLSRPGTLIIADNVIREGGVLDPNSTDEMVVGVQAFNEALAANPNVTATILQTVGAKGYDGIALAIVNDPKRP